MATNSGARVGTPAVVPWFGLYPQGAQPSTQTGYHPVSLLPGRARQRSRRSCRERSVSKAAWPACHWRLTSRQPLKVPEQSPIARMRCPAPPAGHLAVEVGYGHRRRARRSHDIGSAGANGRRQRTGAVRRSLHRIRARALIHPHNIDADGDVLQRIDGELVAACSRRNRAIRCSFLHRRGARSPPTAAWRVTPATAVTRACSQSVLQATLLLASLRRAVPVHATARRTPQERPAGPGHGRMWTPAGGYAPDILSARLPWIPTPCNERSLLPPRS
jgi:hypothetical protein